MIAGGGLLVAGGGVVVEGAKSHGTTGVADRGPGWMGLHPGRVDMSEDQYELGEPGKPKQTPRKDWNKLK